MLGQNTPAASHLLPFYDDMLVFTNGRIRAFRQLKWLLKHYKASSSQHINLSKSSYCAAKLISVHQKHRIKQCLGCKLKSFPFTFIGAHVYKGRNKAIYIEDLVKKITSRLGGWKTKLFSFARKITLIKAILSCIPVHMASCMVIPRVFVRKMEGIIKAFLWN